MGLFTTPSSRKRRQPSKPASHPEPHAKALVAEAAALVQVPHVVPAPQPTVAPAPSALVRAEAEALVHHIAQELPAFLTVAVVEAATGSILAGQWAGHSGGAVEAAVANAEIVRQSNLALEALQLAATEQLTDILITLRHQLHLLRVLPQSRWLLYLAVRTQDANPALLRAVSQLVDS